MGSFFISPRGVSSQNVGWKAAIIVLLLTASILVSYHISIAQNSKLVDMREISRLRLRQNIHSCQFENVEIFIVATESDFPLLVFTLNSIKLMMPCSGPIHLFLDEHDLSKVIAWIDAPNIFIHEFKIPQIAYKYLKPANIRPYLLQNWLMIWADLYVSESADYIMYLDGDSILAMPVTCSSMFDNFGKVYQMSWDIEPQLQFQPPCEEVLGRNCDQSFMSVLPFTIPTQSLNALRQHITNHLSGGSESDFDVAFFSWANKTRFFESFSQFVVMGNFMKHFQQDLVHVIHCPHWSVGYQKSHIDYLTAYSSESASCIDYIPIGWHYGWTYSPYMEWLINPTRNQNSAVFYRAGTARGELERYSSKFAALTIDAIQEMLLHGVCLKKYLETGRLAEHCPPNTTETVHEELRIYGNDYIPDMEKAMKRFKPDAPGTKCPKPAALTSIT